MSYKNLLAGSAFLLLATSALARRESFDTNWKFAKFGKFNDCLAATEPGQPIQMLSASSSENGNPAKNAMDENRATRWCANNGNAATLNIDLGRAVQLSSASIVWEKKAAYGYTLEGSTDGKTWVTLAKHDAANPAEETRDVIRQSIRQLRIAINPPKGAWASIREVLLLDNQGKRVLPQAPATVAKKPYEVDFDDSNWRVLDVPHDWGVESAFLPDEPNETGKLPWNAIGWYRKSFSLSQKAAKKKIYLDFDGVMMTPEIYVNGKKAGEWAYGYSSFRVDITKFVNFGQRNTVAVRAENRPLSTRWYPGAGMYRHVWIVTDNPVHIDHWGVFAHASDIKNIRQEEGKFVADGANLTIETAVRNTTDAAVTVTVKQEIAGSTVSNDLAIKPNDVATLTQTIPLSKTELWDTTAPVLQTLTTTVVRDNKTTDREETSIGVRDAQWKPEGFFLNGRRVQINGVCQHHDMGPLGTAVHTRAIERQIEVLKSFGANTIRTSHNPPAPELLALCDKMGMLVDDEIFDIWEQQKYDKTNGYHRYWKDWHEKDVRNFVKRDRNHPSVIAWSIGNEITEQWNGNGRGGEVAEELNALFKKYDGTRATTIGCNHEPAKDMRIGKAVDVYGFNYKPWAFKKFAVDYPNRSLINSESSSCVSSRGKYYFPDAQSFWNKGAGFFAAQVSSYALYAPGWASRPDVEFAGVDDEPHCAGEFVWTGFDYIGEPTPYNQDNSNIGNIRNLPKEEQDKIMAEMAKLGKAPSRSSYFGLVDLCGFWKDIAYLYQARWMPDHPMAHLLPHWNWVGQREGKVTPVHVFTSGDEAELFLNGQSLGRKAKGKGERDRYRLCWEDVVYTPGTLKVVAYKDGKEWATDTVVTTGPVNDFTVAADRLSLVADGQDLGYVTLRVIDKDGNLMPTADNRFTFSVTGPIEIVGVCNGDATDGDSMKGTTIRAFSGMAQVIVRSIRSERQTPGEATLTVKMEGVDAPHTLTFTTHK